MALRDRRRHAPVTLDSLRSAWTFRRGLLSAGAAEVVFVAVRGGPGRNGGAKRGNKGARGESRAEGSAEESSSCRHGVGAWFGPMELT